MNPDDIPADLVREINEATGHLVLEDTNGLIEACEALHTVLHVLDLEYLDPMFDALVDDLRDIATHHGEDDEGMRQMRLSLGTWIEEMTRAVQHALRDCGIRQTVFWAYHLFPVAHMRQWRINATGSGIATNG